MKKMLALYRKELRGYLQNPANYLFGLLFLLVSYWFFWQNFFLQNQAQLSAWSENLPFLLLFFIPALTMAMISDEKKSGTWEILLSLPLSETTLVVAKFLAGLTFFLLVLLASLSLPASLFWLGQPDPGLLLSRYLAVIFLAAADLSVGLFASSLSRQQVAAFLLAFLLLLFNDIFGQQFFLLRLPPSLKAGFLFASLRHHYLVLSQGLLTVADLAFFLGWIVFFLVLTVLVLRSRDY